MALNDHQIAIIAVNAVFPSLAAVFIGLRLYAKRIKKPKLQADDCLILLGFAFLLCNSVPYVYCAIKGGMGAHIIDLTAGQPQIFDLVTFWTQFAYILAVAIIKISVLAFYRNVFCTPRLKLATAVVFAIIAAWTAAFFFASLFQTWPIRYNWNAGGEGTTINKTAMYTALACSELATSVLILVMPLFVIWKLKLRTSKNWAVPGIFLLGGFVCIISAFRICYFATTAQTIGSDYTYNTYSIFIWTGLEPCMGSICACLPCLGPLFKNSRDSGRFPLSGSTSPDKNNAFSSEKKVMFSPTTVQRSLARDNVGRRYVCERCGHRMGRGNAKGGVKPGFYINSTISSFDERLSQGW